MKEAKRGGGLEGEGAYAERGKQLPEHETEWEDIAKKVESMGFTLVPNENFTIEEGKSKSIKKKWKKKRATEFEFRRQFQRLKSLEGELSIPNEEMTWNV